MKEFLTKSFTIFASLAFLLQSFSPLVALTPQVAYAQEVSPTDTPAPTVTNTPTDSITPTPTDTITPADTVSPTPDTSVTQTPSDTPTVTDTPTVAPTDNVTPTTDQTTPTGSQNNQNNPSQAPPSITPSVSPTPDNSSDTGSLSTTVLDNVSAPSLDLSNSNDQSAKLTTDQADYSPTSTAIITGSGLVANKSYTLEITSSDAPAVDFVTTVTADDKGNFTYAYQLDGNYRPNYTVYIKEGDHVVATTTFTDSPTGITLTQCGNGSIGSTTSCPKSGSGGDWQTGDLNKNNSHYREGDSVPFRVVVSGASGSNSVTIGWQTTNTPAQHAYDYLTSYNRTVTTANPCDGVSGCSGNPSTFAIPTDTNTLSSTCGFTGNQIAGNFSIWGGTITGVSAYGITGCASTATNTNNTITISFTASSSNVVIAWSGHIASQDDWGTGHSASSINGSPYHMDLESCSFGCGALDRALQASGVLPVPGLSTQVSSSTIYLGQPVTDAATYTEAGNNGTVSGTTQFYVCGPSASATSCTSINTPVGSAVTNSSDHATSSSFAPSQTGTYCFAAYYTPDTNAQYSPIIDTVTTNECVTVSNPPTGTLTVNKVTVPSSDTTTQFSITASGSGTISGNATQTITGGSSVQYTVTAGTYSVSEAAQTGWTTTSNTCSNVQVTAGGNASCTITNTKLPTLKIIKSVTNNNGGTASASAFTLHVTASGTDVAGSPAAGSATGTTYTLNPGSYTVSENDPTALGYTQTGISGDCSGNGNITLAAGDNKTCTITNDDVAPSLTLVKKVSNTHGGAAKATDFTLSASGSSTLSGAGGATSDNTFKAGTYTLSETNLSGYQAGSWSCTNNVTVSNNQITLGLGQSTTCSITNSDVAPTLKLVKVVNNNNGGTATSASFTLTASGSGGFSDLGNSTTFHTVLANTTYTLSESGPSGYTGGNWSCDAGTLQGNSLTLSNGQNVTCTITNNDQPGTLIVKKIVKNLHGGTKTASDFSFQVNNGTAVAFNANGENDLTVSAGSYTVTEPAVTGYTASYDNCTGVQVANGGTATCTITNTDVAPQLTVIKHVINDNGGVLSANNFTMIVGGTHVSSSVFAGDENGTTVTLDQGSFSVGEVASSGYTSSLSGDCSGTINVGETKTCIITNDDQPATLTVIKHVINDNGGVKSAADFTMDVTATNATPSSFPGDEKGTSVTLNAGSYSVDEGTHDGYTKSLSSDCTGTIANGETKTCTITNDDIAPQLTLVKAVHNDNGGTNVATDWTLTASGPATFSGTTGVTSDSTFIAGTYTLSESGPAGYSASDWSCSNGVSVSNNQITLANGASTTCTITNSDIAPTLKLVKNVINDNGGTNVPRDWTLTADGTSGFSDAGNSTTFHTVLANTTYTLSESGPSGYTASRWSCDGGSLQGNQLTLGLSQNITCTITNDDNAPSLTLVKLVDGGTANAADFTLTADGPTTISGAGIATSDSSFQAGTYTLSETNISGYTASYWGCLGTGTENDNQITLGLGDSEICFITNTRDTGSITVHKAVDTTGKGVFDGDDTTASQLGFTWSLDKGADNAFGASVSGVTTLDTHAISENLNNQPYHFVGWYDNSGNGSCTNPDSQDFPTFALQNNGDTKTITLCNARDTGTIHLEKFVEDPNGNEITTDPTKFTFTVSQNQTSVDTAQLAGGDSHDFVVPTGNYDVTETLADGYKFLGCNVEAENAHDITNGENVDVLTGDSVWIACFNQQLNPILTITKTNDKLGIDQAPGDSVLYTITITATQSAAQDVVLTDLLPKGFVYRDGSATINHGDESGVQPFTNFSDDYHSPGIWNIGTINKDQTITLTLIADISGSQNPGDYKDVAYAQGKSLAGNQVAALAGNVGNISDPNFVGTDVTVVKNQQDTPSVNVINKQEVLGAATSILPDTGANSLWVILGGLLTITGLATISFGIILKKKYV